MQGLHQGLQMSQRNLAYQTILDNLPLWGMLHFLWLNTKVKLITYLVKVFFFLGLFSASKRIILKTKRLIPAFSSPLGNLWQSNLMMWFCYFCIYSITQLDHISLVKNAIQSIIFYFSDGKQASMYIGTYGPYIIR